ncbi:hypothetical protein [Vibrio sagamiensis]|uniref:DUF2570 domain-containing protein n=1 Tax=Vibrio sagamiensis NBRC 104589 TaxID=1219064 RepID=A0A511QIM5_9VIBR|nr:hypothetical protein [Vibrio sagamiensis]PNQ69006.1 hypothetical protein C1141_06365 [Vibrio agarivorans]GEM77175.1 hypothetical protein VSA01S_32870 [Vibrio sagamiensis NBRC 104589]
MNFSYKTAFLVGVVVLLLGSLAASAYLLELTKLQAKQYGELQGQFKDSLSKNKSLSIAVKTLSDEVRQAQRAADAFLRVKVDRNRVTIQAVNQIKEVLNHEQCADVPIPDAAQWLYYH